MLGTGLKNNFYSEVKKEKKKKIEVETELWNTDICMWDIVESFVLKLKHI